ncbi:hypothetical protein Hdeb2414_s0036g00730711 [Helianthus debilis subsp. tardiflorus]
MHSPIFDQTLTSPWKKSSSTRSPNPCTIHPLNFTQIPIHPHYKLFPKVNSKTPLLNSQTCFVFNCIIGHEKRCFSSASVRTLRRIRVTHFKHMVCAHHKTPNQGKRGSCHQSKQRTFPIIIVFPL